MSALPRLKDEASPRDGSLGWGDGRLWCARQVLDGLTHPSNHPRLCQARPNAPRLEGLPLPRALAVGPCVETEVGQVVPPVHRPPRPFQLRPQRAQGRHYTCMDGSVGSG